VAEQLLLAMRHKDLFAPVIVFASGDHSPDDRRRALSLGARAYACDWSELFREISHVLGAGD
jgi:DNA-binding NarL/FixJ family response regulator